MEVSLQISACYMYMYVHVCMYGTFTTCRAFGAFTMQSILAVAFGRQVNLHSGDENEDQVLISAKTIFEFQKTGTAIVDPFTVLAVTSKC